MPSAIVASAEASVGVVADTTARTVDLSGYDESHIVVEVSLPASGAAQLVYYTVDGTAPVVPTLSTTAAAADPYFSSSWVATIKRPDTLKVISSDATGYEVRITPVSYDTRGR